MYVHSEMLDGGRGVKTIAHPLQKTPPIESVFWTAVQILLSHGREDDGRDVQVRRQTGTPSPQTCLSIDRTWGGARKIPRKREPIPESMAGDPLRSISGATYGSAPAFKYDTIPRPDSKARDHSSENPVRPATEVQIDS